MPTCPICGGLMLEDGPGSNTYTCAKCGYVLYFETDSGSSNYEDYSSSNYIDDDDHDHFQLIKTCYLLRVFLKCIKYCEEITYEKNE